jgi:phospholipid/cholesterol/gamma-HCH transport system substrate-binding protein
LPGQQEVRWSQLKVGTLVIVALAALVALIFLMTNNTGGMWSGRITLRSYFENSAGLKIGAPVNLEGVTVGNVKHILIDPSRGLTPVEVVMRVNRDKAKDIHTDSKSSLETMGVLGDTVVDIDSRRATGPAVSDNAELPTTETPSLQDVIQASQGTIEQLNTILAKVDKIADALSTDKGSIGALINDKTVYNKGLATLNELSALVDKVSNGQGSIGKLINDETLYDDLKSATKGLNDIVTAVNSGKGSAGKLLKDDKLYDNMRDATMNLNEILERVNQGQGSLGILAKDPEFAHKLTDTVDKLDSILTQVDQGQGSIGAMLKDRKLYDHADQVMQDSSDLIKAIRKDPKKYLTIHLKIF